MCGSGAKWKREIVQDHKFTYIDVNEFYEPSCFTKFKYSLVYLIVIKTLLVYLADFVTAYLLLTDGWKNTIEPVIPLKYSKWIFVGSIGMSFLLLLLDWYKARRIIRSKDIAYAFTNITAYRYYSLKSYSYYCVFSKINDHTSTKESLAFWIFFRLKGWKRILFAEAPRQFVNGVNIWALVMQKKNLTTTVKMVLRYDKSDLIRTLTFSTMTFALLMFILSLVALVVAFFLYLPMLCAIRGNLKEYVCHLIDKRIAGMLKRKSTKRIRQEQKMLEKAKKNLSKKELMEIEEKKQYQIQHIQPTLPRIHNEHELLMKPSMESMASTMTAQSTRPLMPHQNLPMAIRSAEAPMHQQNLPMAIRSVEAHSPMHMPMPMPMPTFPDGISTPVAVQQAHGFGARRPYRAASKRVAPTPAPEAQAPSPPQQQTHLPVVYEPPQTQVEIKYEDTSPRMQPFRLPEAPRHSYIPAFQEQNESPPLSPVLPYNNVNLYEGPRPSLDERPQSIVDDFRQPTPSALRNYDDSTDDEGGPVKRKVTALASVRPNYGRL